MVATMIHQSHTFRRFRPHNPLSSLWHDRERRIRLEAYLKAKKRGFLAGHELEDWLEAEAEVDAATATWSQ